MIHLEAGSPGIPLPLLPQKNSSPLPQMQRKSDIEIIQENKKTEVANNK